MRKRFYWKLKHREIVLGDRTLLMGVLNVTPDSFSDGGKYLEPDRAFARALELEEQGADIIDIGAESTKPGSTRISAAQEMQRLVPVLKRLKGHLGVPISVDTYKAEVAERALELGAEIINDPTGLTFEPHLARVASQHDAGLVLNHMRGRPETWAKLGPLPDPMGSIARDLDATISRARLAGVDRSRVVIDPGMGFGKRGEQNYVILSRLGELANLELPIMAGPSRKSFLPHDNPDQTTFATAAAVVACVLAGAHIVRVHDVKEMRAAADVGDEILRTRAEPAPAPSRSRI
jgi:dihydropteroate synthase